MALSILRTFRLRKCSPSIPNFSTQWKLNNSFYRLPAESAVESWRDTTPPSFCFAVKASRFITHMKKLKEPEHALDRFLPVVAKLGRKLGPVLFQLPPGWGRDNERLEQFLQALPIDLRYTFEFRNPEWHHPDIYSILARYNVAFCIFEIAGFHSPVEVTASFVYVRLHGPDQHAYSGDYPLDTLRVWAERLKSWRRKGVTAYLYFDNDQNAFAPRNALELKQLVNSSADCPP